MAPISTKLISLNVISPLPAQTNQPSPSHLTNSTVIKDHYLVEFDKITRESSFEPPNYNHFHPKAHFFFAFVFIDIHVLRCSLSRMNIKPFFRFFFSI